MPALALSPQRWHPLRWRPIPPNPLPATPFQVIQAAPIAQVASLTGPVTVTLPQATGAQGASTLVACVTTSGQTANPAVSSITLGGSADHWRAAFTDPTSTFFGAAIWYDPQCTAGQTSVAVTCSGGAGANPAIYVAVYEVAGVLVFDGGSNGDSASATAWSSGGTPATQVAPEIAFGCAMATSAVPAVTGVGSWAAQSTGAGTYDQVAGYQMITARGASPSFAGTLPSGGYSAVIASFLPGVLVNDSDSMSGNDSATSTITLNPSVDSGAADTASGLDGGERIGLNPSADSAAADTLAGLDTASTASIGITGSDTGTGSDATAPAITASLPGSDTASGTETDPANLAVSSATLAADRGSGVDAGEHVAASLTGAETLTGDGALLPSVGVLPVAAGLDAGGSSSGAAEVAASQASLPGTDTIAGLDGFPGGITAVTVVAALESGAAAENGSVSAGGTTPHDSDAFAGLEDTAPALLRMHDSLTRTW